MPFSLTEDITVEKKLKRVFDYQRFSPNSRLGAMIAETERRYQALDDDDLFLVSAAGDTDIMNDFLEKKDEQRDSNL
jgi:hypothetical protein